MGGSPANHNQKLNSTVSVHPPIPSLLTSTCACTVLEFLYNLWGLGTELEQGCRTGQPGEIGSLESILGVLKRLKIRALYVVVVLYTRSWFCVSRPCALLPTCVYVWAVKAEGNKAPPDVLYAKLL